jgi:integrase
MLKNVVVRRLTDPGRHSDGRSGLHLYVRAAARPDAEPRRSWVLRYRFAGRRPDMGLGDYPSVSLAEARRAATAARALIRAGQDPLAARRAAALAAGEARARTFRAAAEALLADKERGWRNAKHRAQWRSTLDRYAFPELGEKPVLAITTDDVLRVLRPVWERAPETASRLRGRIEAVLDAARAKGWRDGENPARWKGHLAHHLPKPRKVKPVQHHPALPWQRVGAFMAALGERDGMAALALRFAILTAARTGEVRGMRWRELDLDARVWTVPGARMKAGRTHRVPLSDQAAAVLAEVAAITGRKPDGLVFTTDGRRRLSDMTISAVIRRMNADAADDDADAPPRWRDAEGRAIVPHGFRSTFRDWAGETRAEPREVVERCLAHTIKDKTEAAYARGDLLERRRPLMNAWGAFCTAPAAGKVKRLRATG